MVDLIAQGLHFIEIVSHVLQELVKQRKLKETSLLIRLPIQHFVNMCFEELQKRWRPALALGHVKVFCDEIGFEVGLNSLSSGE